MNINEANVDEVASVSGIDVSGWQDDAERPYRRERRYVRCNERAALVAPHGSDGFKWAVFNPGEDFTWIFGTSHSAEQATKAADDELKKLLARYL